MSRSRPVTKALRRMLDKGELRPSESQMHLASRLDALASNLGIADTDGALGNTGSIAGTSPNSLSNKVAAPAAATSAAATSAEATNDSERNRRGRDGAHRNPLFGVGVSNSFFSRLSRLFAPNPSPGGLFIHGGVGVGKSMLMDTFHAACQTSGVGSLRVHFHDFLLDFHRRMFQLAQGSQVSPQGSHIMKFSGSKGSHGSKGSQGSQGGGYEGAVDRIASEIAAEYAVVCFDEFQVWDAGDALILRALFGRLFDEGVCLVATSNRTPRRLYENGINRERFLPFIDLLERTCEVVEVTGEDHRGLTTPLAHQERLFSVLGGLVL